MSVRVRLCDVPYPVRADAARRLQRYEESERGRFELLAAAVNPSEDVFVLSDAAAPLVAAFQSVWKQAA